MRKAMIVVAVLCLMMAGMLTSCGSDNSAKGRATAYMECLKNKDFDKAAKMLMAIDRMNEVTDQQQSIVNMIKSELERDYEAVKSYQLSDGDEYKYFTMYDVTMVLNDATEKKMVLLIQKDLSGENGECSMKDDFTPEGLLASRGSITLPTKACPDNSKDEVMGYLDCLQKADIEGLANYVPVAQREHYTYSDLVSAVEYLQAQNGGMESYELNREYEGDDKSEYLFDVKYQNGTIRKMYFRTKKCESGEWGIIEHKLVDE